MEKKIRQSMHRKKYGCHRIESFSDVYKIFRINNITDSSKIML